MDTALRDGDFAVSAAGIPFPVRAAPELLQRALIRLTVPRGSFPYDPALGSSLHALDPADPGFYQQAFQAVQEALIPLPELVLETLALSDGGVTLGFGSPYGPLTLFCPLWKEAS